MLDVITLLFSWLPPGLSVLVISFIFVFVLSFFVGLIVEIIEIIRG